MFQFVCDKFHYQVGGSALQNMLDGLTRKGEFAPGLAAALAVLRDRGCSGWETVMAAVAAARNSTVADLEALRAQGFTPEHAPLKPFVKGDPNAQAKLDYLVSQGASCTVGFLQESIIRGDMDLLAHAIKLGFPADPTIYIHAAWANRLDMFPIFEERGVSFPYESDSMRLLLQGKEPRGWGWDWHWWWWHPFWIHHRDPWTVPAYVVEALRQFHDHGLAFPEDLFHMCLNVCKSDDLFNYLLEAGAPFNADAIKTARARGLTDVAQRMENQSVF